MKQDVVLVGKISSVFGIKGWLKIFSFTEPRNNVLTYKSWLLRKDGQEKSVKIVTGHMQGKGVVAQIDGVDDRDQALSLIGWDIYIHHAQLPALEAGEYYWADLIGLAVENLEGLPFGVIDSLFETGANDVLLIKGERERAIPFLQGEIVKSIDLVAGRVVVDWDADF